jgi:branched-chain amino acid transport system permease protein
MLELATVSLLNGIVYGLLLFMLTSGLTLIFSMMGVLNFAHASVFMLGAYFSYQLGRWIGFWPALVIAPLLCGIVGAAIERYGLRYVHKSGHVAEILFTFGLAYVLEELVTMIWGRNAVANSVPAAIVFSLFSLFGSSFPAYKGLMMAVSVAMFAFLYLHSSGRGQSRYPGGVDAPANGERARAQQPGVFVPFAPAARAAGLAGVIGGFHVDANDARAGGRADRVRCRGRRRPGFALRRADRVDADRHRADVCGGHRLFAGRFIPRPRCHDHARVPDL